uniref:Uncharacterized protein n=1 Tax=Daphnia magna TaxID=35525 RepID=A0A0P6CU91_9CRUS
MSVPHRNQIGFLQQPWNQETRLDRQMCCGYAAVMSDFRLKLRRLHKSIIGCKTLSRNR